ncbi:uncharacterized protein METZ01_LOCUS323534, partial [marine metagenome]
MSNAGLIGCDIMNEFFERDVIYENAL